MPSTDPTNSGHAHYRPGKQSQRNNLYLIGILFISLVGSFVFATAYENDFFIFLTIGLLICIVFLMSLHSQLTQKEAALQLQIQDIYEKTNLIEAEIQQEKISIQSWKEKIINFSQLKGLTERLSMCLSLEDTSSALSSEVNRLFGSQDITIILYLFHSKTGELGISSSQKGQMQVNIKAKKGDAFDRWVIKAMHPLLIEDTKTEYRFDVERIESEETRSMRSIISVPLMVGNKALGILRMDSPRENCFDTEDLRFLTTIGDLGAVAIENAQLYERVEQLAIKDSLTNLFLRRYLLERMPEELSRQLRHKSSLSFLMIDLDRFKQYNDQFGHVAGDIVLRTVGLLLSDCFSQPGNLVCRYGGEEFAVLLPDCPKNKAVELAQELRKKIEVQAIPLRREKTHITVSIGVASFPKDAQMKEELIHKADLALYEAKQQGRNRVCVAPD